MPRGIPTTPRSRLSALQQAGNASCPGARARQCHVLKQTPKGTSSLGRPPALTDAPRGGISNLTTRQRGREASHQLSSDDAPGRSVQQAGTASRVLGATCPVQSAPFSYSAVHSFMCVFAFIWDGGCNRTLRAVSEIVRQGWKWVSPGYRADVGFLPESLGENPLSRLLWVLQATCVRRRGPVLSRSSAHVTPGAACLLHPNSRLSRPAFLSQ